MELIVAMDMEWIITLVSPYNQTAQISLICAQGAVNNETNLSEWRCY